MKDFTPEEEKQTRENYRKFLADIVGQTNRSVYPYGMGKDWEMKDGR